MEEVLKYIASVIQITKDKEKELESRFVTMGLQSMDDIIHLQTEGDFDGILTIIQSRKVISAISKMQTTKEPAEVMTLTPTTSTPTSSHENVTPSTSAQTTPTSSRAVEAKGSLFLYQIPWGKFPPDIMRAARERKFGDPSDRKEVVRIVVADMLELEDYPTMSQIRKIASNICTRYPLTFGDQWSTGEVMGQGCMSMERQIKWRVDHVRDKKRNLSASRTSLKPPSSKRKDRYGTVNFMPSIENTDHSLAKLNEMKRWLQNQFQLSDQDEEKVTELMALTYPLQRHSINSNSMMRDVREEWPFLFTKKHLENHFSQLMGFEAEDRINEEVQRSVGDHLHYLESFCTKKSSFAKTSKEVFTILEKETLTMERKFLGVFTLIGSHLKQAADLFWRPYEENSLLAEVAADKNAPNTPHIALQGKDLLNAKTAFVVIAEHEVMDEVVSVYEAIFMVIEAFFVFNCHYPPKAACLLEYLARYIMLIEGEGSKTKRTKTTPKSHESKLLTFMRKMYEYHSARRVTH